VTIDQRPPALDLNAHSELHSLKEQPVKGTSSEGVARVAQGVAPIQEPALNCALQAYEKMMEFMLPLALQQPHMFGLPMHGILLPYSLEHQDKTWTHGMTRHSHN